MKLIEALGRRPLWAYRSDEPDSRDATSPSPGTSPRHQSRIESRYLPFHSVHSVGKLPTW